MAGIKQPSPAQSRSDEPFDRMMANFEAARQDYAAEHKSPHWDQFSGAHIEALGQPSLWRNFRNNGLTSGLDFKVIGGAKRSAFRNYVEPGDAMVPADNRSEVDVELIGPKQRASVIAEYEGLTAIVGRDFVAEMHEADIGRPFHITHDGMKLNAVDMRHIHYAWRARQFLAPMAHDDLVVIEIGGGFGGLAAKIKQLAPGACVVLMDLPEVMALQIYYIGQRFPDARCFDYVDFKRQGIAGLINGNYDFAFLPGWIIDAFPDRSVDLVINTESMAEMNRSVVDYYMDAINRITRPNGIFYCVNRYSKGSVGEAIRIKDYPFDDSWYFTVSEESWRRHSIHHLAAVRTIHTNAHPPHLVLSDLPPFAGRDFSRHLGLAAGILRRRIVGDPARGNMGIAGAWMRTRKRLRQFGARLLRMVPALRRLRRAASK